MKTTKVHTHFEDAVSQTRDTVSIKLNVALMRNMGVNILANNEFGGMVEVTDDLIIDIPATAVPGHVFKEMHTALVVHGLTEREADFALEDMMDNVNKMMLLKYIK